MCGRPEIRLAAGHLRPLPSPVPRRRRSIIGSRSGKKRPLLYMAVGRSVRRPAGCVGSIRAGRRRTARVLAGAGGPGAARRGAVDARRIPSRSLTWCGRQHGQAAHTGTHAHTHSGPVFSRCCFSSNCLCAWPAAASPPASSQLFPLNDFFYLDSGPPCSSRMVPAHFRCTHAFCAVVHQNIVSLSHGLTYLSSVRYTLRDIRMLDRGYI